MKKVQTMPTIEQNRRSERQNIVNWILTLEQRRQLLEARFDMFNDRVMNLIMSFITQHGLDEDGNPTAWRRRVSRQQLNDLRRQIDYVLATDLTDNAKVELSKLTTSSSLDSIDLLGIYIALETIQLYNEIEIHIASTLSETVEAEFNRQETLINLDRQYIENHLEDVIRDGLTRSGFSINLWGLDQKELISEVEQLARRAIRYGYSPRRTGEELSKLTKKGVYQATRLMRTEQAKVHAYSQVETYKAQGIRRFDLIVEPDACQRCKDIARGNPYNVDEAEVGVNMQPIHPNCRCSTVGIFDDI